jgi:hypothetical protein
MNCSRIDSEGILRTEIPSSIVFGNCLSNNTVVLGNTCKEIFPKLFIGEVVIPENGFRFDFYITHISKFLHQCPKGMETCNGPTFDGSDEESVCIICVTLDEIFWSLFGRNSNQRDSFVGWFEPYNLWFLLLSVILRLWCGGFATSESFLLLFFLGSRRGRT